MLEPILGTWTSDSTVCKSTWAIWNLPSSVLSSHRLYEYPFHGLSMDSSSSSSVFFLLGLFPSSYSRIAPSLCWDCLCPPPMAWHWPRRRHIKKITKTQSRGTQPTPHSHQHSDIADQESNLHLKVRFGSVSVKCSRPFAHPKPKTPRNPNTVQIICGRLLVSILEEKRLKTCWGELGQK